jgi:uncharacterized membrane protein SirB2
MYKGILHTHYLVVTLFFVLYVIKTILLLSGRNDVLATFTRRTKVFEMIVSALFLITGIYLTTQLPFGGKYDYLFYIKLAMIVAAIPVAIVGFKRGNKILAALSLLLITGSYGIAEVYSKRKGIMRTPQDQEVAAMGASALYNSNCSLCHGADGKLGAGGAKDITSTTLDEGGIREIILKGKGMMAPVKVTGSQADSIARYVVQNLKHP